MEGQTCSLFADVSLLSSESGNADFDVSETQESKTAEDPLSISTKPLHHQPTSIGTLGFLEVWGVKIVWGMGGRWL